MLDGESGGALGKRPGRVGRWEKNLPSAFLRTHPPSADLRWSLNNPSTLSPTGPLADPHPGTSRREGLRPPQPSSLFPVSASPCLICCSAAAASHSSRGQTAAGDITAPAGKPSHKLRFHFRPGGCQQSLTEQGHCPLPPQEGTQRLGNPESCENLRLNPKILASY